MLPTPEIDFRRTPVTLVLAAVVVALELVCTFDELRRPGDSTLRLDYYNNYLGILGYIWTGELWRPFTSSLMHGNLIHAGFNVYWLVVFGPALEHRFGSHLMFGVIFLLGYVPMLAEYVIGSYSRDRPVMIVGLSGIMYGLFGILWIGRRWRPELRLVCDENTVRILGGWFVLCILLTYLDIMPVANIAHGFGFGFGVLYGLVAFDVRRRRRWLLLAGAATGLVLSTLVACPGHRAYERAKRLRRLDQMLQEASPPETGAIRDPLPDHFTGRPTALSGGWPAGPGCRCR